MKYRVTIEQIENEEYTQRGAYTIIDRVPWPKEDVEQFAGMNRVGLVSPMEKEPLKEIRGYAPDTQCVREKTTKIFEQTVGSIKIGSVIKAVNDLP